MNRLIAGLLMVFLLESTVLAEEHYYTTLSNALPKSIAMGGATTAVAGDPLSMGLNPATCRMFPLPGPTRVLVFFNPAAVQSIGHSINDDQTTGQQIGAGLRLLVRFVGVSHEFFDVGIRLSDEIPTIDDRDFFSKKSVYAFHSNSGLLRLKLHPYVSIGLQMTGYTHRDKIDQFAYSYGVLLRPGARVEVGVSYLDNPTRYQKVIHPMLRIADETINIGMSVKLSGTTLTSFDLRNITDEDKIAFLEPHLGVEQILFHHVALRCGGAVFSKSDRKMLTCGIGVLDWNQVFRRSRRLETPNFAAQYGVALEYVDHLHRVWHSVTFCVRF